MHMFILHCICNTMCILTHMYYIIHICIIYIYIIHLESYYIYVVCIYVYIYIYIYIYIEDICSILLYMCSIHIIHIYSYNAYVLYATSIYFLEQSSVGLQYIDTVCVYIRSVLTLNGCLDFLYSDRFFLPYSHRLITRALQPHGCLDFLYSDRRFLSYS